MHIVDTNLQFQTIALAMLVMVIILFAVRRKLHILREDVFAGVLWVAVLSTILDMLSVLSLQFFPASMAPVTDIIRRAYLVSVVVAALAILMYTMAEIYQSSIFFRSENCAFVIPLAVSIPIIFNLSIQAPGETYAFGWAVYASMGFTFMYIVISCLYAVFNKKKIVSHRWSAIMFAGFVFVLCGVFQFLYQQWRMMSLGLGFIIVYMYLGLENTEEYMDKTLEAFNREAFHIYVKNACSLHRKISILYIKINDIEYIKDSAGGELNLQLTRMAVEYFKTVQRANMFALDQSQYMLVFPGDDFFSERVRDIRERFKNVWKIGGEEGQIELELDINLVAFPAMRMPLSMDYDLIMDTLEFFIRDINNKSYEKCIFIDRKQIREKSIFDHVKAELLNVVYEKRIEVWYQPIFSVYDNKCVEMESLMRIRDSRGYYLPSNIVLDIAEGNGSIVDIGYELFEVVCEYVASHNLKAAGIEKVSVNLSVIQCQQQQLATRLVKIMEKHGVPASFFRFEISEITAAYSTQNLKRNMNQLMANGATFVIDDYGANLLDPDRVTQVSADHIKIGRDVIVDYFEGKLTRQYMRSLCRMLQQLKMTITAVGVETQQQYVELKKLGIAQMQGHAFYKPMRGDEILTTLEQEQAIGVGQEALFERVL